LLAACARHFSEDLSAVGVAVECGAASAVVWLALAGLGLAIAPIMMKRLTIAITADQTGCRRGQRRFAVDGEFC